MANENNRVQLSGIITDELILSHRVYGEGFYKTVLKVPRLSGVSDYLPLTVSERLLSSCPAVIGGEYFITGQFRSYNNYSDVGSKLKLTVFAKSFCPIEECEAPEANEIFLDGYLCKEPVFRSTPFGREIADMLIAVNRSYGKSDYIPVIAWSRNARFCSSLSIGTHIRIYGRIQSREYQKKTENEILTKTAYEISASKLELPDNEFYEELL